MFKKALSILLAVMLVVSAFSMATLAAGAASGETAVNANEEVNSVSADDTLTVKATSNLFPERTYTFTQDELAANDNKVTVSYFINSAKDMLNTQWAVRYDGDMLEANEADNQVYDDEEEVYTSTVMPRATDAVINFAGLKAVGESVTFEEAEVTLLCKKLFMQRLDKENIMESEPDVKAFYDGDAEHDMYIGEVVEIIKQ